MFSEYKSKSFTLSFIITFPLALTKFRILLYSNSSALIFNPSPIASDLYLEINFSEFL